MRRSMHWSATAYTYNPNGFRRCAAKLVEPRSAPGAIRHRTAFSTRRHTPPYRLKTASQWVSQVLTALAEGLDVAAAVRVSSHRHATITRWLARAGDHSATLHDRVFQNLHLPHIQLGELRTRLRSHAHVLWLWVAVDPISKLIPVLHLGT